MYTCPYISAQKNPYCRSSRRDLIYLIYLICLSYVRKCVSDHRKTLTVKSAKHYHRQAGCGGRFSALPRFCRHATAQGNPTIS